MGSDLGRRSSKWDVIRVCINLAFDALVLVLPLRGRSGSEPARMKDVPGINIWTWKSPGFENTGISLVSESLVPVCKSAQQRWQA